ncbi:MAG TPA: S8 family peptidase [Thermoanaerobaculia bacterium]|nr:S8 family peptidase [Thermoanaerobaculia bacterium]
MSDELPPTPKAPAGPNDEDSQKLPMSRATIPPGMHDPKQRLAWGLPESEDDRGPYMVELNLLYRGGLEEARKAFVRFFKRILKRKDEPPLPVSKTYYRCDMSVKEWRALVRADEKRPDRRDRLIYRIWPDFPVKPLIYHSVSTVKADAALRSYEASGADIVWGVIDSGIDKTHLHFGDPKDPDHPNHHVLLHPDVQMLHRDFTQAGPEVAGDALTDRYGHGTHVAGIIAGGLSKEVACGKDFRVYETVFCSDPVGANKQETLEERMVRDATRLRGVAPQCRLISLKVLNDQGQGRSSDVMRALEYVREQLNGDPKILRVHGINLSIGYEFDAEMFACGQSPLCVEVDRLVKSGVVVVVAAGNTGYGRVLADQRQTKVGLSNTINDPGNAALAITVGATHRDAPHLYGVSYFSSKGPTGDGRLKPDLVAPGERITSCAAGRRLAPHGGDVPAGVSAYVDDSGTSMAAPHVSGAIAAFLSIRREFIQRPEEVKKIFLDSATSLDRERYFEGHGLLDLMRAIQSV